MERCPIEHEMMELRRFNGQRGTSKVYTSGNLFVKKTDEDSVGSPHAEEAASHLFEHLGVPHIASKVVQDPENPTVLYNVSRLHPTLRGIMHIQPGEEKRITDNPKQIADTLFTEWLANIRDRHGNNYAISKEHPHPISIDHGQAWHPGTTVWTSENVEGTKFPDSYRTKGPGGLKAFSTDPYSSDLVHLLSELGHKKPLPVTPSVIQKALMGQDRLEQLAYEGTNGLPEEERSMAVVGLRMKIEALRAKLKQTGGNLFVHNLREIHKDIEEGKYEHHLRGRE